MHHINKISSQTKKLPSSPGIYKFIDKEGRVLYIGKAKNLKKRVTSYFQKTKDRTVRIQKMLEHVADLQYITVDSELEAILLETNLIKELKPKYNILMRDDKNFVYIKIHQDDDFPRISIVRKIERDKAKYFGPKTAKWKVEKTFDLLHKIFPFRNCGLQIFEKDGNLEIKNKVIKYPCLEYHIKRCLAPCIGNISKEEYKKMIDGIIDFLSGRHETILKKLKEDIMTAASEKNFEKAAKLRDQLFAVEDIMEKQKISSPDQVDQDLISFEIYKENIYFNIFMVRNGKLINQENFIFENKGDLESLPSEIYESFIKQYYVQTADIPKEILISEELEEQEFIENWLSNLKGNKVKITVPQKGKKNKLLELSQKNAENFTKQNQIKFEQEKERTQGACEELVKILGENNLEIKNNAKRIECYDISHLSGTHTVGSMVVFEKGKAKNADYRHFNIKSLEKGQIDDFKAIEEVLGRRLKYLSQQTNRSICHNKYQIRKIKKSEISKLIKDFKIKIDIPTESTEFFTMKNDKKEIIGLTALIQRDKNHYEILPPTLNKPYQLKNFEEVLINKAIEECPLDNIYINAEKNKKDFYIKKGFEELQLTPEIFNKSSAFVLSQTNKRITLIYSKSKHTKDQDASFTSMPDLIIIDGGKGQLSSATFAMTSLNLNIPMIALAKKEEEIYLPGRAALFTRRSFSEGGQCGSTSHILHLLQRIRDEAHRFAITFNRQKRTKNLIH